MPLQKGNLLKPHELDFNGARRKGSDENLISRAFLILKFGRIPSCYAPIAAMRTISRAFSHRGLSIRQDRRDAGDLSWLPNHLPRCY